MSKIVVGLAGHIDHGKTSLVKALTGIDTDSLKQEQERGMTIDLGFAFLNEDIAIIDVPGHEKFIRNMVAGASNIHVGLIVIAADDGVMPQTIEHLEILSALGLKKCLVAITKIDLVNDNEWLDLVESEIYELIHSMNFKLLSSRRVDNLKKVGIIEIKNDLIKSARDFSFSNNSNNFRLFIDRAFSKTGFGTIVTGTVQSGELKVGDELELYPLKHKTKVRGIQSHNGSVKKISKGQRAAINLSNLSLKKVKRGNTLGTINSLKQTKKALCYVKLINATKWKLKLYHRLRFHIGTLEVLGRVIFNKKTIIKNSFDSNVIIEFEETVALAMEDRVVIRSYSPVETIASGVILDPLPVLKNKYIKIYLDDIPKKNEERFLFLIENNYRQPRNIKNWAKLFFVKEELIKKWISIFNLKLSNDELIFSTKNYDRAEKTILNFFNKQYEKNHFRTVLNTEQIKDFTKISRKWLNFVLSIMVNKNLITNNKGGYSLTDYRFEATKEEKKQLELLKKIISDSYYNPIKLEDILSKFSEKPKSVADLLYLLQDQNSIVALGDSLFLDILRFKNILENIKDFFSRKPEMGVSDFKKLFGISRKSAIPLLEYLDKQHFTTRYENIRRKGNRLDEY